MQDKMRPVASAPRSTFPPPSGSVFEIEALIASRDRKANASVRIPDEVQTTAAQNSNIVGPVFIRKSALRLVFIIEPMKPALLERYQYERILICIMGALRRDLHLSSANAAMGVLLMRKIGLAFRAAMILLAGALGITTADAQTSTGIKVGMLTCNVSSGWGIVFGSTRDLNCT